MSDAIERNYEVISLKQFDEDIDDRLAIEDIAEGEWVLQRQTTALARKLGGYALETVKAVEILEACDDGLSVELAEVDEDGQVLGSNRFILDDDGNVKVPGYPQETGYLLAYPDVDDSTLEDIGEGVPVFIETH